MKSASSRRRLRSCSWLSVISGIGGDWLVAALGLRALQVAAVGIVRRAGAFGRDHRCAEGSFRRALLPEGRAIVRFLDAFQHLAADARGRLFGINFFYIENALSVMV